MADDSKYKPTPYWDGRMVRIKRAKGAVPEALQGKYTSFEEANRDIKRYFMPKVKAPVSAKSRPSKLKKKEEA